MFIKIVLIFLEIYGDIYEGMLIFEEIFLEKS